MTRKWSTRSTPTKHEQIFFFFLCYTWRNCG